MHKNAILSDGRTRPRGLALLLALVGVALAFSAFIPALASAARPAPLTQFPGDIAAGSTAGKMLFPRSIAASPVSGDLYVANLFNNRIDEFTAWGGFVRAFGWGVRSGDTAATGLDACTVATGCQQGFTGSAPGQFGSENGLGEGIDVDSAGDVYVTDTRGNNRVLKFGPTGEFLLMFGGEVDHTTGADVCTKEDIEVAGDSCGAGIEGSGDSEFTSSAITYGDHIAVGPDDTVYVGDKERIQEFGPNGTFKGQITFKTLHEELASFPENTNALGLTADPVSGDLYLIAGNGLGDVTDKRVFRIDPESGELVGVLTAPTLDQPTAVAADSAGNVYVVNEGLTGSGSIMEFDSSGTQLIPDAAEKEAIKKEQEAKAKFEPFERFERFGEPPAEKGIQLWGIATDSACEPESDDLYAAYVQFSGPSAETNIAYVGAFGPAPQNALKCPPPPAEAPEIATQYAASVTTDAATVHAEISPGYDVNTTYRVQYGLGKCSEGGCTEEKPLAPGSKLTSNIGKKTLKTNAIFLSGLAPDTTYHYRFISENGAGTVRGVGGQIGTDGEEASFTTFPVPGEPKQDCPNQVFRVGPAAKLTDCRAYELVSPAQRNPRGDIASVLTASEYPAELNQSAVDGERLAYSSQLAFGDAISAPPVSQYIATRHAGVGWSTHAISPQRGPLINQYSNFKFDLEDRAFTADLCSDWIVHDADPVLAPGAIEGFPNIYRRNNCGPDADTYEAVSPAAPADTPAVNYDQELQGFSADGSRTVFRANAELTADAPNPNNELRLYMSSGGTVRFICRLPDGSALAAPCSAGTVNVLNLEGRDNQVANAVSADGNRVYWTAEVEAATDNKIYLRENPDQEQSAMASGKCAEPDKACTYKVSNEGARYWTAATDGSAALYTEGEKLREFDAETKTSQTIAQGVEGVAGASNDLSVYYFVSKKEIGGEGEAGSPNLYRRAEGAVSLVATLAKIDTPAAQRPTARGARITGDGQHLVFASVASLMGNDNRDAKTGDQDAEIYLYDAGAAGPVCISCNPTGARPAGRILGNRAGGVAALIPQTQTELYAPKVISEDGNRVFFNAFDALVPRDTNGKQDVYEWERAGSAEACVELGAELYAESSGGCLSLISSGESAEDSSFVDTSSTNGARDVFFKTGSSLIPEDVGVIDIYDAREGGGLPEAPPRPAICEGEACQGPLSAPDDPTPASAAFNGAGNVKEPTASRCSKGKVRRKGRCAKKQRKHAHNRTNRNRRTAK